MTDGKIDLLLEQEAGGSNPLAPTNLFNGLQYFCRPFFTPVFIGGPVWGPVFYCLEI